MASCVWGQSTTFPKAFDFEAPQTRAALERAFLLASSVQKPLSRELAYFENCEAARLGSAEGHYRSAISALALGGEYARWAKFHLLVAIELGHMVAADEVVARAAELRDQVLNSPPDCLVRQVDLAALKKPEVRTSQLELSDLTKRLPSNRLAVVELIKQAAQQSVLSTEFVMAVAAVESNFNHMATSPKGAMGVMQLIPATAQRFAVSDPYDPAQNVKGGIQYLEWLHRRFDGDLVLVAAAYNSGEGTVDKYKGVPPYQETQRYVEKVMAYTTGSRGFK